MSRVEDVARQKLTSDNKVKTLPETSMVKELMQDLNRYPIIERAVNDMQDSTLSDPHFKAKVRDHVTKTLQRDRNEKAGEGTIYVILLVLRYFGSACLCHHPAVTDGSRLSLTVTTTAALPGTSSSGDVQSSGVQNGSIAQDGKAEELDGNESEDSAMLESPASDAPQNEDKPPFA
ncbi:hypothetical protein NM688_g4062 [Phlebia brevispora]|uniref:Uncharacterized protein n=1 Tax=Phlebia brevispora TaxID=194682 RepID=A0ACC1T431_9APHY|nr:hypothetical protein NM688_g4062 [Phlebia brevispora]